MTPAAAARPVPPAATTPQLLKQGIYASLAGALLFLAAVSSGARSHREAMQVISRDTAPGIIAAQHLAAALADMDASAANELLLTKDDQAAAGRAFEKRRREAADVLISAAENIRYDDERQPIRTLALGLSSYTTEMQFARDLHHAGDPAYLDAYRTAVQMMDQTLLPAALHLDRAKRAVSDRAYDGQSKWSSASMLFLVLSALALTGVLIAIQVFLTRRMRRLVNPFLAVSTAVAVLSFFYFAESFTNADRDLKVAKQDAFESIHLLWKARSAAYSANDNESRWLLDPARAAQYAQEFTQKSETTSTSLDADLKNITPTGAGDFAAKAVADFAEYQKIDLQIRALEHSNQHAAAIRLCTGESNAAFDRFDQDLEQALQINQTEFDQSSKYGFDAVNHLEITAAVIAGAIALLAVAGIFPRLREYSGV